MVLEAQGTKEKEVNYSKNYPIKKLLKLNFEYYLNIKNIYNFFIY